MYLALSSDQEAFVQECHRLLEKECTSAVVREVATPAGSGHSPRLHALLADAGWFEMAVADADDSGSGTLFELGLAFRAAGRALVPTTLHSCVLAARLLLRSGSEAGRQLASRLAAGNALVTTAYLERGASAPSGAGPFATVAVRSGATWVLDGQKSFVLNASTADVILVAARIDEVGATGEVGLFAVPREHDGVTQRELRTFGRDAQSTLTLDAVTLGAESLVAGPFDPDAWSSWFGAAIEEMTALLCMEMLGGTERVLEDTVGYVSSRIVFGRPVGTFQAVQHMLADVAISVNAGRVASLAALWAATSTTDARREVSIAKSWMSSVYKEATIVAHQLFGGAGYVREADLHLWSQRAKATEPLLGDRTYHLRRLASLGAAVSW